jgi:bacillithiol biosynthesis cysteine-adding enzyme BshC
MAELENIPFFPKGYYPELLVRSYQNDPEVKALYPNSGPHSDFEAQIKARGNFSQESRITLAEELIRQYGDITHASVRANIESLRHENTFTVTTGQQIHIFLGPLYVVYKTLSVIALAKDLKSKYPDKHFVPVFWMATEDHDFEEVNHVRFFNREFQWHAKSGGPVGRMATSELTAVLSEIAGAFPNDPKVEQALAVFRQAYTTFGNLADSTRFLLNHFFGDEGLVVLDPDAAALKKQFLPHMMQDLTGSEVEKVVASRTQELVNMGLETAIHGRSPNLFALNNGARERVDRVDDHYVLKQSGLSLSSEQALEWLQTSPEDFSPNVALRPVYQEVILPNLAYVAGPGEYTYWYQLEPVFAIFGMVAPVLIARHSFVISDVKTRNWIKDNNWKYEQLFSTETEFKTEFIHRLMSNNPLEEAVSKLQSGFEDVNSFMYKAHHEDLKLMKKAGEEYLRQLKAALEKYNNNLLDNPLNATEWARLTKVRQRFFNTEAPQEREQYFFEQYIQNWTFTADFAEMTGMSEWPLSFVWR